MKKISGLIALNLIITLSGAEYLTRTTARNNPLYRVFLLTQAEKNPDKIQANLQQAQEMVNEGAPVNKKIALSSSYQTPFMNFFSNNQEILKFLIQNHADVNAIDTEGDTALHNLAYRPKKYYSSIELLLDAGADVNIKNKNGDTPLMIMIRQAPYFPDWSELLLAITRVFLSKEGLSQEVREKVIKGLSSKKGASYFSLMPGDLRKDFIKRIKKGIAPVNMLITNNKGETLLTLAKRVQKQLENPSEDFNTPSQEDTKAFDELVALIERETKKQLEQAAANAKKNKALP